MRRRQFLKSAAAFGSFSIVPAKVLWGAEAPSNQLTRALIGFGGIARSHNHLDYKGSRLIGLCDPDAHRVSDGIRICAEKGWGKVKAYENFDTAIRTNREDPNGYNRRGILYMQQKRFDQAEQDFDTAIKHDSTYLLSYFNRALVYSDTNRQIGRAHV